jgi:hypothetical protein
MSTIWKRYTTSPALPWNLDRAKHLHHRASFGATWSELQRDVSDGPETSINRLLDGTSRQRGQDAEVSRRDTVLSLRCANIFQPSHGVSHVLVLCRSHSVIVFSLSSALDP